MIADAYITPKKAAAALGVTDRTVRRWFKARRIAGHRLEGRILIRADEIKRLAPPEVVEKVRRS